MHLWACSTMKSFQNTYFFQLLKLKHCEKATKFEKISNLFWHLLCSIKTSGRLFQNFGPFQNTWTFLFRCIRVTQTTNICFIKNCSKLISVCITTVFSTNFYETDVTLEQNDMNHYFSSHISTIHSTITWFITYSSFFRHRLW